MKDGILLSSQIMDMCYQFQTKSGKSIKHKLTYFTDCSLHYQISINSTWWEAGMSGGRKRQTRTELDYSSSVAPREVCLLYKLKLGSPLMPVTTTTSKRQYIMCSLMSLKHSFEESPVGPLYLCLSSSLLKPHIHLSCHTRTDKPQLP